MSAQSSYKPSGMVQSMKVKVSTFTQQFSQTEINNLHLGKNNQVRLTNQAMINRIRNSNLSSLTPSIVINPKFTILNQQSSGDAGIPQNNIYTYGTSVLIDPSNGSNFVMPSIAYIYSNSSNNTSFQSMANTIINNSCLLATVADAATPLPSQSQLTTNNSWLPNQYGNGSSYWYNCSLWNDDFIFQQIILYAVLYAYISTVIQGGSVIPNASLNMYTNAVGSSYGGINTANGESPGTFPYDVGAIFFSTAWPFQLTSLSITTASGVQPYQFNVPYDPNGGYLPYGFTGLTTLDANDILNVFLINLPIAVNSGSNSVNNYSSTPTGIVSLTQSNMVVDMSIIGNGSTIVTINNVNFTVNSLFPTLISTMPMNNPNVPQFSSSQVLNNPYSSYSYGEWQLSIYYLNFSFPCPYTVIFTSSNPNLPIVNADGLPDVNGQYVYLENENNINQPQESTIIATAYLFGQPIPNATYSYTCTFNLQQPNRDPYF